MAIVIRCEECTEREPEKQHTVRITIQDDFIVFKCNTCGKLEANARL